MADLEDAGDDKGRGEKVRRVCFLVSLVTILATLGYLMLYDSECIHVLIGGLTRPVSAEVFDMLRDEDLSGMSKACEAK